ncbi:hypothetical protein [Saccharopolyspora mangrovi]|uniref:Secreted protein n=1 Tax=Saccharopolyspora mangrovi TaxID=3082379 RepID=A0ABU6A953_9PSEU|nr:hypothetical protein [Saccharopolyspora sp. S2-29]MEB3368065.1 hypothetical protein [Saccharopolyspora sp. S2-29]
MSLVKMAAAVGLAAAMASGQGGCQAPQPEAQHNSQVQPEQAAPQQPLPELVAPAEDDMFGGFPVEPGTNEAVLCENGRVVDYWPHQEWKRAKAPAECVEEDQAADWVAEQANELDNTDSEWRNP